MITRVLAVTALILAAVSVHFYNQTSQLRAQLEDARQNEIARARHLTAASLDGEGQEIRGVMKWLDDFYKSKEGLQRPDGLWIDGHPDYEGLGVWVFDVYLRSRLNGDTDAVAKSKITTMIQGSDEWKTKHPPQN